MNEENLKKLNGIMADSIPDVGIDWGAEPPQPAAPMQPNRVQRRKAAKFAKSKEGKAWIRQQQEQERLEAEKLRKVGGVRIE